MSNFPSFWDGKERIDFYCSPKYVKKLRGFRLAEFVRTSGTTTGEVLYQTLRKQLDLSPAEEVDPFGSASEAAE
jgi:hypothetical protein